MTTETLKSARILVLGLGGLGCAATTYLATAVIGNLTLVDADTVSRSNLQRQILHRDEGIDQPKVESARHALQALNPACQIVTINAQLNDAALAMQVREHDVVLDCTDNVTVRQQLNRACHTARIPLISGAAIRMEGQVMVFT